MMFVSHDKVVSFLMVITRAFVQSKESRKNLKDIVLIIKLYFVRFSL